MRLTRTVDVAAPPEALYDVLADASRLQDWVTIHDELIDAPEGPLVEGSEVTQRLTLAGRRFTVHWTVVEDDRPRRLVWQGLGPVMSKAGVIYELQAVGDGTRFAYTNEYDLPGGPLARLAGPVVAKVTTGEIDASLERLRMLVE